MNHYIGTVKSVERAQGKSGKTYYKVVAVSNGAELKFNSFDDTIIGALNKQVEFTLEQQGIYSNLKSLTVLPTSQQQAQTVATTQTAAYIPTTETPDARQENINRQSALNAAVATVAALLAVDINPTGEALLGAGKVAAAKAAKDPTVLVEWVKQLAKMYKHFVQRGDWTFDDVKMAVEASSKEDMPF